ncbi:MAG: valine--tRNA ligase, partial [Saprospiraceae bacterium]|nr:valine--tRNA ligase [Saprospiraceae bacterium]
QTAVSDLEVVREEEDGQLFFFNYPLENGGFIPVATTRPETILGDTAVCVHPEDDSYRDLVGQYALVPMLNRRIPVIADDYVDREFGTGALKITPAHDFNDYEIAQRHNLELVNILNKDATLNQNAGPYAGMDRFEARKKLWADMEAAGMTIKVQDHTMVVPRSQRGGEVVEPMLSTQWFVQMDDIAEKALNAVRSGDIKIVPERFTKVYYHWLENIQDWCISRQLWWGHRIPAYYYENEIAVAETAEEALEEIRANTGNHQLTLADLRQDEDVLDTWFSSWLWPFSVFNGMEPNPEVDYYYPTSVLVTGWDIIFLWVARMTMSGYEWKNERPFKHVYFTGMVRDQQRRKMSKSLGNSPDALTLIDTYGADGVRFGILSSSPAGGDLLFDEKLCEQGRNFCNKMWNALRLVKGWESNLEDVPSSSAENKAIAWMESKIDNILQEIDQDFKAYRLSDAQMKLYSFIWNDFCSWYLEWIKPGFEQPLSKETYERSLDIFSTLMRMLHPYMPFITEEIWHILNGDQHGDCMVSKYPESGGVVVNGVLETMEHLKDVIGKTRDLRNKSNLKPRDILPLYVLQSDKTDSLLADEGYVDILRKSAWIGEMSPVKDSAAIEGDANLLSFVVGTDKYYLVSPKVIDVEEEIETLKKDLDYQHGFVNSIKKKLDNERFVANAPEAVVEKERQKMADGLKRIEMIKESLARLL